MAASSERALPRPSSDAQDARNLRRARALFLALVLAYAGALAVLYALGLFGFVWKTLVVPSLFIVAYAARRLHAFVRDWAVFLGAIVLFDSARGLVYALVVRLSLPVYMHYVIGLEQGLFGAPPPSVRLQQALIPGGALGWLPKLLVTLHASHFLAFLFFGLLVWLARPAEFARFKLAIVIVMYTGIAVYLVLPTVPPWMAAGRFFVLDHIEHVPAHIYNLATPELAASFDVNPIAAMPSLHAAFPVLLALVCFEHFGRWGLAMLGYALAVLFAVVALGEHYVVDVLAGCALSLSAYLVAYKLPWVSRLLARARPPEPAPATPLAALARLRRPLLLSGLLLVAAQGAGFLAIALHRPEVPSEAFVTRELDGQSPMAAYYHALNAYYAGNFKRAQPLFARALHEVPDVAKQARAYLLLGESAFHNRDWKAAIEALGSQPRLDSEQALMLAQSRLELGQRALGLQVLEVVARSAPADPVVRAHLRKLELEFGRAGR